MVQIGRRVLSNYFKMIINNRFYAKYSCFSKMRSREHQCGRGTFGHRIITYKSLTGDYSSLQHHS